MSRAELYREYKNLYNQLSNSNKKPTFTLKQIKDDENKRLLIRIFEMKRDTINSIKYDKKKFEYYKDENFLYCLVDISNFSFYTFSDGRGVKYLIKACMYINILFNRIKNRKGTPKENYDYFYKRREIRMYEKRFKGLPKYLINALTYMKFFRKDKFSFNFIMHDIMYERNFDFELDEIKNALPE